MEITRKVPVWLRPTASFETPMCAALSTASKAIQGWTSQHPDSYPPMVINISDGDATDGNPEPMAQEIKALGTSDGNTLLYNAHLSEMSATPVQYLAEDSACPRMSMRRGCSACPRSFLPAGGPGPPHGTAGHPGFSRIRLQRRHGGPSALPGHRHPSRFRSSLIIYTH